MARKVLNRKELREEHDTAERQGTTKKTAKKKAAKKATRRKKRKVVKEVRLKAYWGVFSQSLKPVVMFEYSEREQAQDKAKELSTSAKSPHFVQLVKKVLDE